MVTVTCAYDVEGFDTVVCACDTEGMATEGYTGTIIDGSTTGGWLCEDLCFDPDDLWLCPDLSLEVCLWEWPNLCLDDCLEEVDPLALLWLPLPLPDLLPLPILVYVRVGYLLLGGTAYSYNSL